MVPAEHARDELRRCVAGVLGAERRRLARPHAHRARLAHRLHAAIGDPTIDPVVFPSVQGVYYWTSSAVPGDGGHRGYWTVDFAAGSPR